MTIKKVLGREVARRIGFSEINSNSTKAPGSVAPFRHAPSHISHATPRRDALWSHSKTAEPCLNCSRERGTFAGIQPNGRNLQAGKTAMRLSPPCSNLLC